MCAVSLFLKLVSFHHVMSDVRTLNGRVKKYSKENKEKLKPQGEKGMILSVPKVTYDQALTYPECLDLKELFRFIMSPTFCY